MAHCWPTRRSCSKVESVDIIVDVGVEKLTNGMLHRWTNWGVGLGAMPKRGKQCRHWCSSTPAMWCPWIKVPRKSETHCASMGHVILNSWMLQSPNHRIWGARGVITREKCLRRRAGPRPYASGTVRSQCEYYLPFFMYIPTYISTLYYRQLIIRKTRRISICFFREYAHPGYPALLRIRDAACVFTCGTVQCLSVVV